MSHRPHADVHTNGLFDDCGACAGLAENPFGEMDSELLGSVIAAAVERASTGPDFTKSEADLVAEKNVLNVLERVGKIAETNPAALERYLRGRWHIRCRIEGRN